MELIESLVLALLAMIGGLYYIILDTRKCVHRLEKEILLQFHIDKLKNEIKDHEGENTW